MTGTVVDRPDEFAHRLVATEIAKLPRPIERYEDAYDGAGDQPAPGGACESGDNDSDVGFFWR